MVAPAVVGMWVSLAERVVALWRKMRRPKPPPPTGATGGNETVMINGVPHRRRPRPGALALLALLALVGCAGPLADLEGDELMEFCRAVVPPEPPCEPCPPCLPAPLPADPAPAQPVTPPAPKAPAEGPREADTLVNLWKPLSDSQPPRAFWITSAALDFARCTATTRGKKGKTTAATYRPPRANGNRQHWDFHRPGATYGKGVRVTCTGPSGTRTWTVPDGAQRWETR